MARMSAFADRLLLVLCALVGASALTGLLLLLDRLGLAREQQYFAGGCLLYTVVTLSNAGRLFRRRSARLPTKLLAAIVVALPIPIFLTLFTARILPWPTSMALYVLGTVALSPAITLTVDRVLRATSGPPKIG